MKFISIPFFNTAIVAGRLRPAFFISISVGLIAASNLAQADVVTITPTAPSANVVDQIRKSAATLLEFQAAVVNSDQPYPGGERTIQLEAGLYDFSAVVIPFESIPAPVPAVLQQLLDDFYSVGIEDVYVFNPLGLPDPVVLGTNGHGIAIYHREHLTISGAPLEYDGQPTTVINGNVSIYARGNIFENPASAYNVGFTVADSSNHITIEQITSQNFMTHLQITSNGNIGTSPPTSPFWGNGTDDVIVQSNRFEVDRVQGIGIFGRNHRVSLLNNTFVTMPGLPFPSGWLVVNTIGIGTLSGIGHLVDFLVEDNTLENCLSCIRIFDSHDGTIIRDNHFTVRSTPEYRGEAIFQVATSHGIPPTFPPTQRGLIEDNYMTSVETADPAMRGANGILGFGGFDWNIVDNEIRDFSHFGIWLEWGVLFSPGNPNGPTLFMIPWTNGLVEDNDITDTGIGILVGAFGRDIQILDNDVRYSSIADYQLNGIDAPFGPAPSAPTFGPASGIVLEVEPDSVVLDFSGCSNTNICDQYDDDSDGFFGEDPTDNLNNDGDTAFGVSLVDEDPTELPNLIIDDD